MKYFESLACLYCYHYFNLNIQSETKMNQNYTPQQLANMALVLRIGLGIVFIIGGLSKLSQLLDESASDAMVSSYMGSSGYINQLFQDFFFSNAFITPWGFLSALSGFEFVTGIALVVGFMVRPIALLYAFLLWTFVIALPVETVPGASVELKTYTSPAIFVQIRDIALSGLMFVLFNLGAGYKAIDSRFIPQPKNIDWNSLGLVLRLSVGIVFLVAGFFGQYEKIATFATFQPVLAVIGLALIFANPTLVKIVGGFVGAVMVWYIFTKLNFDKSIIANLNGVKREFALIAASYLLVSLGGGSRFNFMDITNRSKAYLIPTKQKV